MFGFLSRCRDDVARYRRRRRTTRQLADLDDRQLKDNGINRGDIGRGRTMPSPLREI